MPSSLGLLSPQASTRVSQLGPSTSDTDNDNHPDIDTENDDHPDIDTDNDDHPDIDKENEDHPDIEETML